MVKIIKNTENVGFTAGFHIGVNASEGEYILMLNNDAVVYPNALEELIKFMDNNKLKFLKRYALDFKDRIRKYSERKKDYLYETY